jgi:hypothetical protein
LGVGEESLKCGGRNNQRGERIEESGARFDDRPYRARGIAPGLSRGAEVQIGPDPSIRANVTPGDRVRIGSGGSAMSGMKDGATNFPAG